MVLSKKNKDDGEGLLKLADEIERHKCSPYIEDQEEHDERERTTHFLECDGCSTNKEITNKES